MPRPKPDASKANITIADSTRKYMMDGIRYVCETFRKRLPGTQSERDAQAFFKEELSGYSDEVVMEDFTLHPRAFMGFIPIAAVFMLVAVPLFLFSGGNVALAVAGAALPFLATLMFLFEFLFYRSFVDFLFPRRVSRNVYAVRKPSGDIKKRIIFGGHTDACNEWTYSWLGEKTGIAIAIGGGVAAMLIGLAANLVNAAYTVVCAANGLEAASKWQGGWLVWSVLLLCTVPFGVMIAFFVNYKVVVDGANDNLTANYIAMSVIKEMHESGMRFEHTEVGCLLTGAEEAGLRGARAFARAHLEEFSDPAVETVFVAMDTMREIEELRVCGFGCTGTVKNDRGVGELIREAGRACGLELPDSELYPGAVDAEAFSALGLRASGLTGVSHDAKRYYHTRMDTPDDLDEGCIAVSLNICKEAARIFDARSAGAPEASAV